MPTEGSGGELVLTHNEREQVIDLGVADAATLAFAAFYADCTHEIFPVRKGHRVLLVFDLVLRGAKSSEAGRAPAFDSKIIELGTLLQAWTRDPRVTAKIVWLLEHDYSAQDLSFATLKGVDAVVARTLAAAAERAKCSVHAAIATITEFGHPEFAWGYDDLDELEMEEVKRRYCSLMHWVAPDDSRPQYGLLRLDGKELMPEGALDDAEPDETRVDGASSDSETLIEHTYRNASLVVWPTAKTIHALAGSNIGGAIEYVASEAARSPKAGGDPGRIRNLLTQLMDIWDERAKQGGMSLAGGERLGMMLSVLDEIGAADLTSRFLRNNAASVYEGHGNDELAAALGMAGADMAAEFLPNLVRRRFGLYPQPVLDLLWALTENRWRAESGAWRQALVAGSRAAIEELPKLIDPPVQENSPNWVLEVQRAQSRGISAEVIGDLFALAARIGLQAEAAETVPVLSKLRWMASPAKSVPKALARMRKRDTGASESAPYRALWALAAEHLRNRSLGKP